MNCGILTFYFAHNYGAVLQAYALQTYISELGHRAYMINDYPEKLRIEYSINLFLGNISFRQYLRKCKVIPRRIRQYYLFEKFIKDNFNASPSELDAIVCGSNQIWNERITGETPLYHAAHYGELKRKVKVL